MATDPILDALDVADGAVREMMGAAAAVGAAASAALLTSESREEFLGHLNLASAAFQNGEVAQRALLALAECRNLLARRGLGGQRRRRRIMETIDRVMAEIVAVLPVSAAVQ